MRALLGISAVALLILAMVPAQLLQPPLNRLLRTLRLPYDWLLWAEVNSNLLLHFLGALLVTALLRLAALPWPRSGREVALSMAAALALVEAVHALIGRGFSVADLATGAAGVALGLALTRDTDADGDPRSGGR